METSFLGRTQRSHGLAKFTLIEILVMGHMVANSDSQKCVIMERMSGMRERRKKIVWILYIVGTVHCGNVVYCVTCTL